MGEIQNREQAAKIEEFRKCSVLQSLSMQTLRSLLYYTREETFYKNARLLDIGSACKQLVYMKEGSVAILRRRDEPPRDQFGEQINHPYYSVRSRNPGEHPLSKSYNTGIDFHTIESAVVQAPSLVGEEYFGERMGGVSYYRAEVRSSRCRVVSISFEDLKRVLATIPEDLSYFESHCDMKCEFYKKLPGRMLSVDRMVDYNRKMGQGGTHGETTVLISRDLKSRGVGLF